MAKPLDEARRVMSVAGGPVLVEGPVAVTLADGSVVCSGRPVVAVCACRRSARYPFCDTSHRRPPGPGEGQFTPAVRGLRSDV